MRHFSGLVRFIFGKFLFSGGINFEQFDLSAKKLKYRILLPRRMELRWQLAEFWPEDGPYSAVADLNNIPGQPSYWSSGFLSVQFAVESTFLQVGALGGAHALRCSATPSTSPSTCNECRRRSSGTAA